MNSPEKPYNGDKRKILQKLKLRSEDSVLRYNPEAPSWSWEVKCLLCEFLSEWLDQPHGEKTRKLDLGNLNEVVLLSSCGYHHTLFAQSVPRDFDNYVVSGHKIQFEVSHQLDGVVNIRVTVWDVGLDSGRFLNKKLRLVSRPGSPATPGQGRLVKLRLGNVDVVKKWRSECDTRHGPLCLDAWKDTSFIRHRPFWLIDCVDQRLVRDSTDLQYVALSYVWGCVDSFKTLKENVLRLQGHGALASKDIEARLPATIKDAIELVSLIGERYLWTDSLCIVQDDEEGMNDEISNMAAIFAGAILTIVGTGKNADSGLPGLSSRRSSQTVYELGTGIKLIESQEQWVLGQSNPWNSRAWTFQESIFSRRKLFFSQGILQWDCSCASWQEDIVEDFDNLAPTNVRSPLSGLPKQLRVLSILRLANTLKAYNVRDLTRSSDAHSAIAGTLSAFGVVNKGGSLCGMPVLCFDDALLWDFQSSIPGYTVAQCQKYTRPFPSWSWLSFQGNISFPFATHHVKSYWLAPTWNRTYPLVKWYSHSTLDSPRRELTTDYYALRERYFNSETLPPPEGWTRHAAIANPRDYSDYEQAVDQEIPLPSCFYTNADTPPFKMWFPIAAVGPDDPPQQPVSVAPLLSCRTRRAWLSGSVDVVEKDGLLIHTGREVALVTKQGVEAGILRLSPIVSWPPAEAVSGARHIEVKFELVEISWGRNKEDHNPHYSLTTTLYNARRQRCGVSYEFYNVIFIEREGRLAYRRGLGMVDKQIWDSQEPEFIDLTLG